VPELPDDGEPIDVAPPRVVAPPPDEVEEPELPEPDELDPLEGGADLTGCCSEYLGAETLAGAENVGAGDAHSRATAWVEPDDGGAGVGAGAGAEVAAGGADRGTAWADAVAAVTRTTALPASKLSNKRLCARMSLPPDPYSATLLPSSIAAKTGRFDPFTGLADGRLTQSSHGPRHHSARCPA
jgi:hypothetical protein